jgi:hypothetical protein
LLLETAQIAEKSHRCIPSIPVEKKFYRDEGDKDKRWLEEMTSNINP